MSATSTKTKKFAEGLCFRKLFFVFLFGCIFGCYYEMVINFFIHLIYDHELFWEIRSGLLYGPFSVIYGFGAMLLTLIFARRNYKWWQVLIFGGLIGGLFEFAMGYIQEFLTGTTSWNYSNQWLNFGGRTSPYIMLLWGIICLIFIKVVYPVLSDLVEKIPPHIGEPIFRILLALIIVDGALSLSAVVRANLRHHEVPQLTPYDRFIDTVYDDERLHRDYPNMVRLD